MLNERLAEVESEQLRGAATARPTQSCEPRVAWGRGPHPMVLPLSLPWEGAGDRCCS